MALDERLLPGSAFAGETLEKNLERILDEVDAKGLPTVTATDNGKILKVVDGEWAVDAKELPPVTAADNGKILKVVDGEWAVDAKELPPVTAADNGKVLKVVDGAWAAVTESAE